MHGERYELGRGQLIGIRAHEALEVTSLRGRLWITQVGDGADHVVEEGQRICLPGNAHTVIRGIGRCAVVAVTRACAPALMV